MATQADGNLITVGAVGPRPGPNQYFVRGRSPAMLALERTIADIAPTNIPVLLVGESGTGKEVLALEIHRLSKHRNEAFVKCGCAGLTADSLTARMNYDGNGSATAATSSGTLFLDEISQLDPACQSRLLNFLPDGAGVPPQNCLSVRIISSTTRNLEDEMRNGRFREELYYRINGVHLRLPPLRDRVADIPALLDFFLKKYTSLFERPEPQLSAATLDLLTRHTWPGNIRELENAARKIVALGNEKVVMDELAIAEPSKSAPEPFPAHPGNGGSGGRSLKDAAREASRHTEREMILKQLERTHWNRKKTARDLQISYKALLYKLKQLGLDGNDETERE
jgi:two-component system, NtrC family, response regulator AtoC